MPVHTEQIHEVNGVTICSDAFGNPADPALLLIMGATASMLWWPDALCHRLAEPGRYVIRYDHRDTGRSVSYEPGQSRYTVEDLADDAVGVLDAHHVGKAHLVGMSLGGYLAQLVALKYPARTLSLTLIGSERLSVGDPSIPGIAPDILAYHARAAELDWANKDAVIEYMVGGWQLLSGSARPFEEDLIREIATREVHRAHDVRSSFNHALLTGGEPWLDRLDEIRVPTLVIHGTEDPVLRYEHGVALTRAIAGAELLPLVGAGHELHRLDWDTIADAVTRHTARTG